MSLNASNARALIQIRTIHQHTSFPLVKTYIHQLLNPRHAV